MTETERMRGMVAAWGRTRWPDARAMFEVTCDDRRIDILFVRPADLIGVELKASTDTLARLEGQARAYNNWFPEWWLAIAPRWEIPIKHRDLSRPLWRAGVLVADAEACDFKQKSMAVRDELVIMRTLEWLWASEAAAIAERTDVWPGARRYRAKRAKLQPMLARLLTGNEIMREVCRELRSRPGAVGSDPPMYPPPAVTKKQ